MAKVHYVVSSEELSNLVKNHDSGSQKEIEDNYGGVNGLADKLHTDINHGISNIVRKIFHYSQYIE